MSKRIDKTEVENIILKMNQNSLNDFSKIISNHFHDDIETFYYENEDEIENKENFFSIERMYIPTENQELSELQQKVVMYFMGKKNECKEKNLDYNEHLDECCPANKIYNPETKRCRSNIDHKIQKQKTKEYCTSKNLIFNPVTKKCCKKDQEYNPQNGRCKTIKIL